MFVIQYTLRSDEYENWKTEIYPDLSNATSMYGEYRNDNRYDAVRIMMIMDSIYK
jgi:hypothetical protein